MSSTALVPQDLISPRGFSLVTSGIYKVRVAWRTRWLRVRTELDAVLALRRAQFAEWTSRVRLAMDSEVSPRLAAYRVSEAHALPSGAAAPLDAEVGSWVQPLELAASFLDIEHRKVLARHWMTQGQGAHAAIAAYTQLAAELLAMGAHPDLLMHVHAAALERVHHAEGAFSVASAFAGFGISPSAWPELPRVARPTRNSRTDALVRIAERALLEGWLSTSFGAAVAEVGAVRASEPAIANHLRMVAEDSSRQAEFGVRLIDWALKIGGEPVAHALAMAIRKLPAALTEVASTPGIRNEVLERNGVPGPSLRKAIYLSARAQVVAEVAKRLDGRDFQRLSARER